MGKSDWYYIPRRRGYMPLGNDGSRVSFAKRMGYLIAVVLAIGAYVVWAHIWGQGH
jgi:hypothetical protein